MMGSGLFTTGKSRPPRAGVDGRRRRWCDCWTAFKMTQGSAPLCDEEENANRDVCFDDFQILRAIGKGSFGKVCIVQKKDTKKIYAMKYMNKCQCIQKEAFKNVLKEIEILSNLDHPLLVNLWFTFQDEEDMFMVVDLLLGGDLRFHLQQSGHFEEPRVTLYICELANALDYLRSQCIVHRDIKPDNILLDEQGHVHITDFNIAVTLEDNTLASSMSGTKPYMAPEVFECAMDQCPGYSFPADWWSLGVCAYEMLCNKRPFDIHSDTSLGDVRRLQNGEIKFPVSHVSPPMADLVSRMLARDPASRLVGLEALRSHTHFAHVNFEDVQNLKTSPNFIPKKDQLNCDPTFELEEMIIESKPLHKKKKRLSKQSSRRDAPFVEDESLRERLEEMNTQFIIYNREKELARRAMEEKERLWEVELNKVMS